MQLINVIHYYIPISTAVLNTAVFNFLIIYLCYGRYDGLIAAIVGSLSYFPLAAKLTWQMCFS